MDFSDTTALIPARDEARCIAETLTALARQGKLAGIILVDDQSSDGTGEIARNLRIDKLTVIDGSALPPGWSGKLWALEQAAQRVDTRYSLLLDADIALAPGMLAALRQRAADDDLQLASIMACLPMDTLWEKLLLPPFIYFFKLIYPFALSNRPTSRIAAAAGGCILIETDKLREIGGFEALHGAIIDDCTLARLIKRAGGRTWIGLSRDVRAVRPYASLENIWEYGGALGIYAVALFNAVAGAVQFVANRQLCGSRPRPGIWIRNGQAGRHHGAWGYGAIVCADDSVLRITRFLGIVPADRGVSLSPHHLDLRGSVLGWRAYAMEKSQL